MNVLCLEDDEDYALILSHAFKAQSTVSRAACFTLAEPIMARVPPDLILLDLTLCDSTPEETIARIAALKARPAHPKVVVLTGNSREAIRRKAYAAGADLVLQKSTDFRATRDAIMQLYRPASDPAKCLDSTTVEMIEAAVQRIAGSGGTPTLPSVPRATVAAVVQLLTGPMGAQGIPLMARP